MAQLDRRVQKLEALAHTDKASLLFITWVKPDDQPPCLVTAEWNGEHFSQGLSESEASFLARVRDAVERNPPAAHDIAAVFLQGVD